MANYILITKVAHWNKKQSIENSIDYDHNKSFLPIHSHPSPMLFCVTFTIIPLFGIASNIGILQAMYDLVEKVETMPESITKLELSNENENHMDYNMSKKDVKISL